MPVAGSYSQSAVPRIQWLELPSSSTQSATFSRTRLRESKPATDRRPSEHFLPSLCSICLMTSGLLAAWVRLSYTKRPNEALSEA
jgi:hypothetical protein